jgi:histidinol dehydrogenase
MLRVHIQDEPKYQEILIELSRRGDADLERVEPAVREIIRKVRAEGDSALRELALRFDRHAPASIVVHDWRERARAVPAATRAALAHAAERVRRYHEHQREPGFRYREAGIELGQRVRPMRSAAVYAPGGKARYPSTVLMTAIPAAVAGVPRIVLVTPNPPPEVLAAAELAGVTDVVDAGGAQAVAAVAYGTESVARVDKIVGPGNLYVTCAKRLVFGVVDIDGIAGPSEILVVADDQADPRVVAADLLSQAEHDEAAYPLLVTLSRQQAEAIDRELVLQLELLPRREIATAALRDHGFCFVSRDLAEAARVADLLAPEHLSLQVRDPDALLENVSAAGAAFLGDYTPEAAGDYAAGPSHVLPTGGAARFGSPLGVYDFVVRTSLIRYDRAAIVAQQGLLAELARMEGLEAHARAALVRQ